VAVDADHAENIKKAFESNEKREGKLNKSISCYKISSTTCTKGEGVLFCVTEVLFGVLQGHEHKVNRA
jgi:hypothetical protein